MMLSAVDPPPTSAVFLPEVRRTATSHTTVTITEPGAATALLVGEDLEVIETKIHL